MLPADFFKKDNITMRRHISKRVDLYKESKGRKKNNSVYRLLVLQVILAAALIISLPCSAAEEERTQAEWTVMIYLCGSNLESDHGMASYNLREISEIGDVMTYEEVLNMTYGTSLPESSVSDKVNILLETGGCKEWKTGENLGFNLSSEVLQRWQYVYGDNKGKAGDSFLLMEEKDLANMSSPETLADFIQWSVRTCPAKKYALVLWDHGGGSVSGILVDELFDNDIMYLNELEEAMKLGGTHFETVILDACMMANLETAEALSAHASYMVASEEEVSGYGSAMREWLKELYLNPGCGGRDLGIIFCNTTQRKYAELGDRQASDMFTYSVIDLSQIDNLSACFDEIYTFVGDAYTNYPSLMWFMHKLIRNSETFGHGKAIMLDLGSLLYNENASSFFPLELRGKIFEALNNCLVYCVRGNGRTGVTGLSFCYAVNMEPEDIEIYSHNCKSPHYLAFLDAVTDWDAQESLYERVQRLPDIENNEVYDFDVEIKEIDGFPVAAVSLDQMDRVGDVVLYEFYYLDENYDAYIRLGRDECDLDYLEDTQQFIYITNAPNLWPSIEGEICSIEFVNATTERVVYNIPFQMGVDFNNFRCGYIRPSRGEELTGGSYELYGIWDGFDDDSGMPNRNILFMSSYVGREFQLLFPILSEIDDKVRYIPGEIHTMHRNFDVEESVITVGNYAICYIMQDIIGRELPQEMHYIYWDGENFQYRGTAG